MVKEDILAKINAQCENTLMQTLGIVFTDLGDDFLVATMSVDAKVHQSCGLLHGGASVALAETLGSCLSSILLWETGQVAVGVNISAHHLKSKKSGVAVGKAKIIKKGKSFHFVEVEIRDDEGQLICLATMNNMVINGQ